MERDVEGDGSLCKFVIMRQERRRWAYETLRRDRGSLCKFVIMRQERRRWAYETLRRDRRLNTKLIFIEVMANLYNEVDYQAHIHWGDKDNV